MRQLIVLALLLAVSLVGLGCSAEAPPPSSPHRSRLPRPPAFPQAYLRQQE
jgi:hypothetical protein